MMPGDNRSEDVMAARDPEEPSAGDASSVGMAIGINGRLIVPESQMPGGEDFKADASKANYIIIQFTELPGVVQEKKLRDLQVQFCRKIPPVSWLARFMPSDLSPIRELPFVVYANPYDNKLSLDPDLEAELRGPSPPRGFAAASALPSSSRQPTTGGIPKQDTLHNVFVVLHPRARTGEEIRTQLVAEFKIPRERLALEKTALHAQLTADEIRRVAKIDDVYRVEQIPEMVLHNHLSRIAVNHFEAQVLFDNLKLAPGLMLDGAGEIIVICDTGLDRGNLAGLPSSADFPDIDSGGNVNPKPPRPPPSSSAVDSMHPFFDGRILFFDNRSKETRPATGGQTPDRDKCEDYTGHGTHVAGIALGRYHKMPNQPAIQLYAPILDGVASGASLIVQNIFGFPTYDKDGKLESEGKVDWGQKIVPKREQAEDEKLYRLHTDPYFGYPENDFEELDAELTSRYDWRARIHSSSWGASVSKGTEIGYDYFAEIADSVTSAYPELLVVRCAGNDGDNPLPPAKKADKYPADQAREDGQILSWACAKNVMTVGTCYSNYQYIKHEQDKPKKSEKENPPETRLYYAYRSDGKTVPPYHVARSSSRGPTVTKYIQGIGKMPNAHIDIIKPDVVAPGIGIYSSTSRARHEPSTKFGTAPESNPLCAFESGSSMAAPMVAGCAALLRQALRQTQYKIRDPSAALLKAFIINGAVDLSRAGPRGIPGWLYHGNEERLGGCGETRAELIGPAPDNVQGWGRLDIADSVDHVLNTQYCAFRDMRLTPNRKENGPNDYRLRPDRTPPDSHAWKVDIHPPPADKKGQKANFKATLVWMDTPGEGLQNKLALSLVFDDKRFRDKDIAVDSTGKGNDPRLKRMANNNVQKLEARDIEVREGEVVKLVVTVTAVNLVAMKLIEGELDTFEKANQAYALVWKIWYG